MRVITGGAAAGAGAGLPRVAYWLGAPDARVVERFNAIADLGALDFEAWFDEAPTHDARLGEAGNRRTWRFAARIVGRPGYRRLPLAEMRALRPDLLVQDVSQPHFMLGLAAGSILARRTALPVLPVVDGAVPRRAVTEMARHVLFRSVDAATVPGADGSRTAGQYGLPDDRCFRLIEAIDIRHYAQARQVPAADAARRRMALGLGATVYLYVGDLAPTAGLTDLLDAYEMAAGIDPDISLLLLGEGPADPGLGHRVERLPGAVVADEVTDADLPSWLALGDCLVFPSGSDPSGIVVEEAMAAGLPVIATSAAGDIGERVWDGTNGFVVPPSEPRALAARLLDFATIGPDWRQELSAGAVEHAESFSVEHYAEDFVRFATETLAQPKRETGARSFLETVGSALLPLAIGSPSPLIPPAGDLRATA